MATPIERTLIIIETIKGDTLQNTDALNFAEGFCLYYERPDLIGNNNKMAQFYLNKVRRFHMEVITAGRAIRDANAARQQSIDNTQSTISIGTDEDVPPPS